MVSRCTYPVYVVDFEARSTVSQVPEFAIQPPFSYIHFCIFAIVAFRNTFLFKSDGVIKPL